MESVLLQRDLEATTQAPNHNQAPQDNGSEFVPIVLLDNPAELSGKTLAAAQSMSQRFSELETRDEERQYDNVFDPAYVYFGKGSHTDSDGELIEIVSPAGQTTEEQVKDVQKRWATFAAAREYVDGHSKKASDRTDQNRLSLIGKYLEKQGDKAPNLDDKEKSALSLLIRNTLPRGAERDNQGNVVYPAITKDGAKDAFKDLHEGMELAVAQLRLNEKSGRKHVESRLRDIEARIAAFATSRMFRSGDKLQRRLGATKSEEERGRTIGVGGILLLGYAALQGGKALLSMKGFDISGMSGGSGNTTHTATSTAAAITETISSSPNSSGSTTHSTVTETTNAVTQTTSGTSTHTPTGTETGATGAENIDTRNPNKPIVSSPNVADAPEQSFSGYGDDSSSEGLNDNTKKTFGDVLDQAYETVDSKGTVKSGDTLSERSLDHIKDMAKAAGVDVDKVPSSKLQAYWEQVAKDSNIKNPDLIYPGDKLDFTGADKKFLGGLFDLPDGADTAVPKAELKVVPEEIQAKASAKADEAIAKLHLPTEAEIAKSLKTEKIDPGEGVYQFLKDTGVQQPDVREGIMQAWLGDDGTLKSLTTGDNPLMYEYDGTNGTELRLSHPGTLSGTEQETLAEAYKAAYAHEHNVHMMEIARQMLKDTGLDPEDYDLAA